MDQYSYISESSTKDGLSRRGHEEDYSPVASCWNGSMISAYDSGNSHFMPNSERIAHYRSVPAGVIRPVPWNTRCLTLSPIPIPIPIPSPIPYLTRYPTPHFSAEAVKGNAGKLRDAALRTSHVSDHLNAGASGSGISEHRNLTGGTFKNRMLTHAERIKKAIESEPCKTADTSFIYEYCARNYPENYPEGMEKGWKK